MRKGLAFIGCASLICLAVGVARLLACDDCDECDVLPEVSMWTYTQYKNVNQRVDFQATAWDNDMEYCPPDCYDVFERITAWQWKEWWDDPAMYGLTVTLAETGFSPADSQAHCYFSAPGHYYVKAIAWDDDGGVGSDYSDVYVIELDIEDIDCVPVGGLVPVSLSWAPTSMPGCLELSLSDPGGNVAVYLSSDRTGLILGPYDDKWWNYVSRFPHTVYVDGLDAGMASLWLQYRKDCTTVYPVAPDGTNFNIVDVELDKMATGNTPDLPMGRMCVNATNAQSQQYNRAKYRARVYGGGTAAASSTGARPVTFAGINGSNPSALADEDLFWAIAEGSDIGAYEVTLTHNCAGGGDASDAESDYVFKFEYDWVKYNYDGAAIPTATYGDSEGWVSSPHPGDSLPDHGASVTWYYNMEVVTDPDGMYSGKVECQAKFNVQSEGIVSIYNDPPSSPLSGSLSISLFEGWLSFSFGGEQGSDPHEPCLAGFKLEVNITGRGAVTNSQDLTSEDAGDPLFGDVRTWDEYPDLSLDISDNIRTWTVGTTTNQFTVRIGAASEAKNESDSYVVTNRQAMGTLQIFEDDGIFEIVP